MRELTQADWRLVAAAELGRRGVPPTKVPEIRRLACEYGRLQEASCNYGLTSRQEARERNIEARLAVLGSEFGISFHVSGDPRGATVYITETNDKDTVLVRTRLDC